MKQPVAPIAIGSDHNGYALKEQLRQYLLAKNLPVVDYGCGSADVVDYPEVALTVARAIAAGKHERGILVCGTGIGMAIAANKVPGVYAAQCHDPYSADRARKSNDAQIITFGARVVGAELAKMLIDIWLEAEFAGGDSARKVSQIRDAETSLPAAKSGGTR